MDPNKKPFKIKKAENLLVAKRRLIQHLLLLCLCLDPLISATAGSKICDVKAERANGQIPYFIPPPLQFSQDELNEIKQVAVKRNIALLQSQIQDAADSSASDTYHQTDDAIDIERRKWMFEHERRTFEKQSRYSDIVFLVAHTIVAVGLWLTYRQFKQAETIWKSVALHNEMRLQRAQRESSPQPIELLSPESSDIEIGIKTEGLSIRTRIVGLAILVISLAFYYLMLEHVYEIKLPQSVNETRESPPSATAAASNAQE